MTGGEPSIALVAPITFGYVRYSDEDVTWFAGNTLRAMLERCGLTSDAIDGLSIASFSLAPDTPASLCEYLGLELRYLEALPFGGASGVIAANRAARAIRAGDADVVACIGADTLRTDSFGTLLANFSSATMDGSFPYAAGGANLPFALMTRAYMDRYGATRTDFGRICVAQRYNANHCAHALLGGKQLSLADYLAARAVVEPLHLYDCVMPCAGAEGFLVMSEARARELGQAYVVLKSAFESFNTYSDDPVQLRGSWSRYGAALYERSDVDVSALDIVETYDDYPVVVMIQLEGMGLCPEGAASRFVRENALTFDGDGIAHNTSGGQLSAGQAGAAGGFLGIVEAIRQLTGSAAGHQVRDPTTALVTGFGMVNYDRGICSGAAILASGNV